MEAHGQLPTSTPSIADLRPGVDTRPIRKGTPADGPSGRYQERVENSWEHNADDVAAKIDAMTAALEPEPS